MMVKKYITQHNLKNIYINVVWNKKNENIRVCFDVE